MTLRLCSFSLFLFLAQGADFLPPTPKPQDPPQQCDFESRQDPMSGLYQMPVTTSGDNGVYAASYYGANPSANSSFGLILPISSFPYKIDGDTVSPPKKWRRDKMMPNYLLATVRTVVDTSTSSKSQDFVLPSDVQAEQSDKGEGEKGEDLWKDVYSVSLRTMSCEQGDRRDEFGYFLMKQNYYEKSQLTFAIENASNSYFNTSQNKKIFVDFLQLPSLDYLMLTQKIPLNANGRNHFLIKNLPFPKNYYSQPLVFAQILTVEKDFDASKLEAYSISVVDSGELKLGWIRNKDRTFASMPSPVVINNSRDFSVQGVEIMMQKTSFEASNIPKNGYVSPSLFTSSLPLYLSYAALLPPKSHNFRPSKVGDISHFTLANGVVVGSMNVGHPKGGETLRTYLEMRQEKKNLTGIVNLAQLEEAANDDASVRSLLIDDSIIRSLPCPNIKIFVTPRTPRLLTPHLVLSATIRETVKTAGDYSQFEVLVRRVDRAAPILMLKNLMQSVPWNADAYLDFMAVSTDCEQPQDTNADVPVQNSSASTTASTGLLHDHNASN